jgi:tetratricopeptide (TPR) repeat protein
MIFRFKLNTIQARVVFSLITIFACVIFAYLVAGNFVETLVTDYRVSLPNDVLAQIAQVFPDSPGIQARLAQSELTAMDRQLPLAESAARRAVALSPYSFKYRITLASVLETEGKRAKAEESLQQAVRLAPNRSDAQWQLANFLVRQGRLVDAAPHFKHAVTLNARLLREACAVVWQGANQNLQALDEIVPTQPAAKLIQAFFLLEHAKVKDAVDSFLKIDKEGAMKLPGSSAFVTALKEGNHLSESKTVYDWLLNDGSSANSLNNVGFEADILPTWNQFDWSLRNSKYAKVNVDSTVSHSGNRSLKIEFNGLDTTNLDQEAKQLTLVEPGKRYHLECFVKTGGLATTESALLVVSDLMGKWLTTSNPIREPNSDWMLHSADFDAPASNQPVPVYVSVKRKPKFSYDEPTRGTIWLDDFALTEIRK